MHRRYRTALKNSNFVRRQILFQRAVDTPSRCVSSPPDHPPLPPFPLFASEPLLCRRSFDPAKSAGVNRDSEMGV